MSDKFQNKYRIPSNRWQFWDYSAPGSYFITICIEDQYEILGKVANANMELSEYGQIAASEFLNIPKYHKRIKLDRWVVMPNHIHCIITLGAYDFDNGVSAIGDNTAVTGGGGDIVGGGNHPEPPSQPMQPTKPYHNQNQPPSIAEIKQYRAMRRRMLIPKILGKYQMLTSKRMNLLRNTPGRKNWQHDYNDHVIRNTEEYERIDHYIINNPLKWGEDRFNENNPE